jgi:hypothetical protein
MWSALNFFSIPTCCLSQITLEIRETYGCFMRKKASLCAVQIKQKAFTQIALIFIIWLPDVKFPEHLINSLSIKIRVTLNRSVASKFFTFRVISAFLHIWIASHISSKFCSCLCSWRSCHLFHNLSSQLPLKIC